MNRFRDPDSVTRQVCQSTTRETHIIKQSLLSLRKTLLEKSSLNRFPNSQTNQKAKILWHTPFNMTSWVLFPRLHLAEIEDQTWCPSWLREHTHRALARMWQTSNSAKGSPATQACELLLRALGGPQKASEFTFVDACAGAGGPTPLLEAKMNEKLTASGYAPVDFVLTDLWPDIKAWQRIIKRSEHISFVEEPVDATKPRRMAKPGTKECRIFNLCFHHFKDEAGGKVLASAIQSTDAFMYVSHPILASGLSESWRMSLIRFCLPVGFSR
jgi:hypothetical protein